MSKFKQLIVRLFNIKAEDLPERSGDSTSSMEISKQIREEVSWQVKQQLAQSLQGIINKEIQKNNTGQDSETDLQMPNPLSLNPETIQSSEFGQAQPSRKQPEVPDIPPIQEVASNEVSQIPYEPSSQRPPHGEINTNLQDFVIDQESLEKPVAKSFPSKEFEETYKLPIEENSPVEVIHPQANNDFSISQLHPFDAQEIRIGIDFGTTTTAVSIKIGDERPEALPIGKDGTTRYMPSIIYFPPGSKDILERAIVGEEAESYGDQANIIRSVKRCISCQDGNCSTNNGGKGDAKYPFPWCRGDGMVYLSSSETLMPSKITYLIVREALSRAVNVARDRWRIDLTEKNVCFTPLNLGCGAKFDYDQRELLCSVAKDLGFQNFKNLNIVEEPILAGYTFSRFAEHPEGRALIYDFGGGTFDVAVLDVDRIQNDLRVTVVATDGENWLGGDDIDTLVYEYFLREATSETGLSPDKVRNELGNIDNSRLRLFARTAKEQLSSNDHFSDVLFTQKLGTINLDLTRDQFEQILINSRLVQKSLDAVLRACKLAYSYENAKNGKTVDSSAISRFKLSDAASTIGRVILVGGVTKIPSIRNELSHVFGEKKIIEETVIEPISAVAIGGAYPREPQHYSICVPPFGFYLEYEIRNKPGKYYQTVFEPFEYYDFHKYWISTDHAAYFKDIEIVDEYIKVKMCAKRVGEKEPLWCEQIGLLNPGRWRFSISLEGDLSYSKGDESPRFISGCPIIHPIQTAIKDARKQRQDQSQKRREEKQGDYKDWIKDMMNEN